MPLNGLLVERANAILNRDNIKKVPVEAFAPGRLGRELLPGVAASLEIVRDDAERAALEQWPDVLQDVIRAAIHGAVVKSLAADRYEDILPATLAWVPAYDYTVTVWQAHSAVKSAGGLTIVLGSPYPQAGK